MGNRRARRSNEPVPPNGDRGWYINPAGGWSKKPPLGHMVTRDGCLIVIPNTRLTNERTRITAKLERSRTATTRSKEHERKGRGR